MKLRRMAPVLVFAGVLGVHAFWHLHVKGAGPWVSLTPDEADASAGTPYLGGGRMWLGLSYALAGAFAAFCLLRFHENRRRAVAGTAGGLALTGFLYAAGCFLLGCCGSPMLAVYLGLFGSRFLGLTGPMVFGVTLASVAVGYACVVRKSPGGCPCDGDADVAPGEETCGSTAGSPEGIHVGGSCPAAMRVLVESLQEAADSERCRACGCARDLLRAAEEAVPVGERSPELEAALDRLRAHLTAVEYDCRGCAECYGAIGMNALQGLTEQDSSPMPEPHTREGWPPLAGDYKVLRYGAPVAVCTLTDVDLARRVAAQAGPEVSLVGSLQTENLGIERVVANVVSNPSIRFLVLCGADSRGQVGHLPGQSLLSLARSGTDERGRIVGARGRRAVIRNIPSDAVERFRRSVQVLDLIGATDVEAILNVVRDCARRSPGPAEPFEQARSIETVRGRAPERMAPDPRGYFVVFVDARRGRLCLEHYTSEGVLDSVIEGANAAELYCPAIERGLVSRLDHAAYLGRELARAERALRTGESYVQDAAAEGRVAPCASPSRNVQCER